MTDGQQATRTSPFNFYVACNLHYVCIDLKLKEARKAACQEPIVYIQCTLAFHIGTYVCI